MFSRNVSDTRNSDQQKSTSNRGLIIIFLIVLFVVVIIMLSFKRRKDENIRKESDLSPHSLGITYNSQDFGDFMKTSQQQILEIVKKIRKSEIKLPETVLVSQLIVGTSPTDKVYHLDLLTSIQMNLLNPTISEYHLLQIDETYNSEIMSLLNADKKIKIHYIHEKINMEIFVKYCNENLKDRIVIYLNQPDVYFDLSLIHASKLKNEEYVKIYKRMSLSKPYDCNKNEKESIPDGFIVRTGYDKPIVIENSSDSIISMIFNSKTHNCEISTTIYGWFLHDPITIDATLLYFGQPYV